MLFHAVHNVAIQGIFDGSTIDTGLTKWITTEFGIGMVIVGIVLGSYFWRRRPGQAEVVPEAVPLMR